MAQSAATINRWFRPKWSGANTGRWMYRMQYTWEVDYAAKLKAARERRFLTMAGFARAAGTSRARIADIEAGRSSPTLITAERLANLTGHTLAWMTVEPSGSVPYDPAMVALFKKLAPDHELVQKEAFGKYRADIVAMDSAMEHLDLTWVDAQTIAYGREKTVKATASAIQRCVEIRASLSAQRALVDVGKPPELVYAVGNRIVLPDPNLDHPVDAALDFMLRSIRIGAQPTLVRHIGSGYLLHHGYPWPWVMVPWREHLEDALTAIRRDGDGNKFVSLMAFAALNKIHWVRPPNAWVGELPDTWPPFELEVVEPEEDHGYIW